ncbi:putative two-component system sensor protein, no kinase domain [Nonlabens marinus S1-08]|uniref:Putative two-component system sensor protein, no kinase domain n=2 Tax=Nonlabens TaxID=363408 RepID=W8VP79_9FLAO|nr:putative two-component system sensor protein, no kinase domain [Nonlabens marinus S1-08]
MEVLRELLRSSTYLDMFLSAPLNSALGFLQSSVLFLAYALFSYVFLFYRYKKQGKGLTLIGIIAIALAVIGLRYMVEEIIIKAITGYGNYYEGTTALYYITDNLYYAILYTAFGVCWFFIQYSSVRDRQQQELLLENKKSELAFLKSQINPHFLFNMLNNIYSLINMQSDKALPAIEKLSQLLRYSLYETDKLVSIRKELEAVNGYIELEKLRFRESVQTTITTTPNVLDLRVAPFMIMPLVENAFKHGVVTNAKRPIEIHTSMQDDQLVVWVRNAIAKREKHEVGGIGIENLQKRLLLTYGDHFKLLKEANDEFFKITIIINLKS